MRSNRQLPTLLLRADADAVQGTGHVMRCLALAQAWCAQGGGATFITRCESAPLRARITLTGASLIGLKPDSAIDVDVQTTLTQLDENEAALLVVDGYHFDSELQQALKKSGHPLLVIDDNAHLPSYHGDLLLNQNLGSNQLSYRCDPEMALLLGPTYALLRPEFSTWRRRLRCIRTVGQRILVTLGGSDPDNFTLRVIQALDQLDATALEIRVAVGAANRHLAVLVDAVRAARVKIELLHDVTDMAALMAWADFAISAGGTTCWELACMGLPTLVVILAENQQRIAAELHTAGVVQNLGCQASVSSKRLAAALETMIYTSFRRLSMSEKGRWLVDGRGASRVVQALIERSLMRAA